MKSATSFLLRLFPLSSSTIVLLLTIAMALGVSTSCGSGASSAPPKLTGNTSVTVLLSSTANDQLQSFAIGITGITLTNQAGKVVRLMSAPQGTQQSAEFIHINGGVVPFVTVSVPQDIYTAANVAIGDSFFSCVTLTPDGGLDTSTFAYGFNPSNAPPTTVTVNLASPITVTGNDMGLALDLQVSQSVTYSACFDPNGNYTYSIQPTFNLAPVNLSAQATNPRNGKVEQLQGEVTALGATADTFTLTLPSGPQTLAIKSDAHTAFQGIPDFSGLAVGTFVDMDGCIQSDGSLLAGRIGVQDASAVDVQSGPAMIVGGDPLNGEPSVWFFNRMAQGQDPVPVDWPYNVNSAAFQISGQLTNLQTLPFVPSFTASNVVAGQNVYTSTHTFRTNSDPYTHAATLTLMPQTINGTVTAASTSGNFTDYTISLAPYNLFSLLAVQAGQTTLLTNPSQVEVYVDNNTQRLNTQALAPGSTLRFYGLVFNDNGTLRMDCARVNDGVAFTARSNSNAAMRLGKVQTTRSGVGGRQQITTTIRR